MSRIDDPRIPAKTSMMSAKRLFGLEMNTTKFCRVSPFSTNTEDRLCHGQADTATGVIQ